MFICKFCNMERKNANSLRNHERLCRHNENAQKTPFQDVDFNKKHPQVLKNKKRSNQYIAAAEKNEIYIMSDKERLRRSQSMKSKSKEWREENARRISKTIARKVFDGEWHTSLAKRMHLNYKGVDLHGTWEFRYVQYLDRENIEWIRCKNSFPYLYENKERRYTPDFYLPETNQYIEIKGYKTDKDLAKWNSFPINETLVVLLERDLKNLKII